MILTIINQKGGVGKTATSHALGTGLAKRGHDVLMIDMDAQANLTYEAGLTGHTPTVYEVLRGEATISEAAARVTDHLHAVAASPFLIGADMTFKDVGKEYRLREALTPVRGRYGYIIIDTPPAAGVLTVNALTASDRVIIPTEPDIHGLQGVAQIVQTIEAVRKYCNPALKVEGLLITRYNARTATARASLYSIIGDAAQRLGGKVFDTRIRECIAIKDAAGQQRSIFEYAPKSNGAKDYGALIDEILQEDNNNA